MAYNQIVTLRAMRPAYNIKEESGDEWKTFIANDQFNDLLTHTIRAVRNNDADTHKSIWIAGTYGSGKSHAGAVIRHLLCDSVDDIRDYVDAEYHHAKYDMLRNSLYQLREKKRLFPVNLYGQQNIAHEEDLSLQMQREIKTSLKEAGIDLTVQTDFDMYVQHVEQQPAFWEALIGQNPMLAAVAPDTKKLKQRLQSSDPTVLDYVRESLRKGGYDIRLQSKDLQQWIFEVQNALREKTDYNGLLIIWDEFTSIPQSSVGMNLMEQMQKIAEAMMNEENDSYFMLISHPSALGSFNADKRNQTIGRYHYITYNMEPVSAFKIMSRKFMIVDDAMYQKRQNRFFSLHSDLLNIFSQGSAKPEETKENIRNLFPLHPATANLATYYAREAGSSSRSVFEFLVSDAVRNFLADEDAYNNERTITADYLWDYVQSYFESDSAKFGAVTERYNSHHLQVESQGEACLKVFKGILLLNALNNIANSDSVTPSTANIENLFVGTEIEMQLADLLDFFNDKSIIQRQPDGNFSILFTALPGNEIREIQTKLRRNDYLYTDSVIKFGTAARKKFDSYLTQVARPMVYQFFSLQSNEYTLLNRIDVAHRNCQTYETFVPVLVARNAEELAQLKDIAERNSHDDRYKDTTPFLVVDAVMGDKQYDRFIEYQANAICAQSHSLPQQHQTYTQNAEGLLSEWVGKMRSSNVTFYLRGDSMTIVGGKLASTINTIVAPNIYINGPESLEIIRTRSSATFWKKAASKATVDAVLSYNTKQDIISKCQGPMRHVEYLLQDSVDENLAWKPGVDPNHPLKKVCDYVDEWLSGRHTSKNTPFNLGDKLKGLTEAPYGLFQSYAPMAMVAFAMRQYANKIFDTNGKQRTSQHLVEDVLEMFKAWEAGKSSNKLMFMFESKEAGKVCNNLIKMFNLKKLKGYSNISSLKDARWAVQNEYCRLKGFPLWALKYSDECTSNLAVLVENLVKIVSDPESMKNPNLLESTMNSYEMLKTEFGNLLLDTHDNFRKGFVEFMMMDDLVALQAEEVDEALSYLHQHLQAEVGMWTEDEVVSTLKDWRNAQLRKRLEEQQEKERQEMQRRMEEEMRRRLEEELRNRQQGGGSQVAEDEVDPEQLKQKRNRAINRMRNAEDLEEALERMINSENSYIIDTLLKYV